MTERQQKVHEMRAKGMTLRAIARVLRITPQRVQQLAVGSQHPCVGCGKLMPHGRNRWCRNPCLPPDERRSDRPRGGWGENLVGRPPYGQWTVIARASNKGFRTRDSRWLRECTCGRRQEIWGHNLKAGLSTRCRECQSKHMREVTRQRFAQEKG